MGVEELSEARLEEEALAGGDLGGIGRLLRRLLRVAGAAGELDDGHGEKDEKIPGHPVLHRLADQNPNAAPTRKAFASFWPGPAGRKFVTWERLVPSDARYHSNAIWKATSGIGR